MTKRVALHTIEHGIRRALSMLGDQGVEEALKVHGCGSRSASLIRKCGDPDDERHHLQFRYALALDAACQAQGEPPPLLDTYRNALDGSDSSSEPDNPCVPEILFGVVNLQAALSRLSHLVTQTLNPNNLARAELSPEQRHDLFEAIDVLQRQAQLLKRSVSS